METADARRRQRRPTMKAASRLACAAARLVATSRGAAGWQATATSTSTAAANRAPAAAPSFRTAHRSFASSTTGGSGDDGEEDWGAPARTLEDVDDLLDAWGALLDAGDHDGVLRLLEARTAGAPGLPPLGEVWASAASADGDAAARRAYEAAAAAEVAARRTRLVDGQGRAYGTGRRKAAVARVWVRAGSGAARVNGAPLDAAFPALARRADVLSPLAVTGTLGAFDVRATVVGGGPTGQAQAVRHGLARALQLFDPAHRPALKAAGLLTRDPRAVERKKPGRAKARKAFQWVKR